jgi:hypothetical protein
MKEICKNKHKNAEFCDIIYKKEKRWQHMQHFILSSIIFLPVDYFYYYIMIGLSL